MSIKIANDTANGNVILKGQNVTGDRTITMPNLDCELAPRMQLMTAQNSTSSTSIDFTGIPSWAKKIMVTLYGVSTNGTSLLQVQLGSSGVFQTINYASNASVGVIFSSSTSGLLFSAHANASGVRNGIMTIVNITNNAWVSSAFIGSGEGNTGGGGGCVTLSGTLDRVRITTVNGTDLFDAGQIGVLYEG